MNGFAVVDASLAVKWLLEEEYSDNANSLARSWADTGTTPVAPYLMPVEVTNVLHRRVVRGELIVDAAISLLETLLASGVELRETPRIHVRALELADQLQQGAVYDAHYLALAESLDCEMWTADVRLFRSAGSGPVTVKWIGDLD